MFRLRLVKERAWYESIEHAASFSPPVGNHNSPHAAQYGKGRRMADFSTLSLIHRIAEALERLAPKPPQTPDFRVADAFVWRARR